MANLTDVLENRVAAYVAAGTAPAALTAPIKVVLLSALGTGDAAGTPVTVATTAKLNYGATVTADTASNAAILRWEGLANPTTVAGYRLEDSAVTPTIVADNIPRKNAAGTANETVSVTGGIFEVAAGGLTFTAS